MLKFQLEVSEIMNAILDLKLRNGAVEELCLGARGHKSHLSAVILSLSFGDAFSWRYDMS